MIQRAFIRLAGAVQGVGFRFTAEELAYRYGIKGYVRNMYDGRVEVVAQGKSKNVDLYVQALKTAFPVQKVTSNPEPIQEFSGFEIRF